MLYVTTTMKDWIKISRGFEGFIRCLKCYERTEDGYRYEQIELCTNCHEDWNKTLMNVLPAERFWWRLYYWCNQIDKEMYDELENQGAKTLINGGLNDSGLNKWGGTYPEPDECKNCNHCTDELGNLHFCFNCTAFVYDYKNPLTNKLSFGFVPSYSAI